METMLMVGGLVAMVVFGLLGVLFAVLASREPVDPWWLE